MSCFAAKWPNFMYGDMSCSIWNAVSTSPMCGRCVGCCNDNLPTGSLGAWSRAPPRARAAASGSPRGGGDETDSCPALPSREEEEAGRRGGLELEE